MLQTEEESGTDTLSFRIGRPVGPDRTSSGSESSGLTFRIGRHQSLDWTKIPHRTGNSLWSVLSSVRPRLMGAGLERHLDCRRCGTKAVRQGDARDVNLPYVTPDDALPRRFALDDPIGFVRAFLAATINDLRRAPELILALSRAADEDPRLGRYRQNNSGTSRS